MQRTERRRRPSTGATYAWLVDSTAMVNHYYFYVFDDDFGPFFVKFCSYFPYSHIDGQRASTLRFGDPRVQALLAALLRFDLLPAGFRNRELRETVAPLRGMSLDDHNAGQMTYDLRRLRLRGLIERIPHTQRYRLTAEGLFLFKESRDESGETVTGNVTHEQLRHGPRSVASSALAVDVRRAVQRTSVSAPMVASWLRRSRAASATRGPRGARGRTHGEGGLAGTGACREEHRPGSDSQEKQNPGRIPEGRGGPGAYLMNVVRPGGGVKTTDDGDLLSDLEAAFSPERLGTYVRAVQGDRDRAVRLYRWNTAVCAAFYGPLQDLEVALRNAMHRELAACYGEEWTTTRRPGSTGGLASGLPTRG